MLKKVLSVFICIILCFQLCPCHILASEEPELSCLSAILIDTKTNTVLYEKDADTPRPIASLTKIMTMLIAMEKLSLSEITLDDSVVISQRASEMGGTRLFLEKGEVRSVKDLLYGIAVESGNDAAVALAEYIGKDYETFIDMMNKKAEELNLTNTHFSTPCGLSDENNYSTARDIAALSQELLKYEEIFDYIDVWNIQLNVGKDNDVTRNLTNTNKLLSQTDYVDGIKTGYTQAAGHCISATAQKGDMRLICVVLKGADSKSRFEDAKKLLEYGFYNFDVECIIKANDVIATEEIYNSQTEECTFCVKESIFMLKSRGENLNIETKILIDDNLKAPINSDTKVGTVTYKINDDIYTLDIYPSNDIQKKTFFKFIQKIKCFLLP